MPPERASISFISSSSARRTSPDSKKRRRQPHGSPSWPRPSKPPNHERQRPLPGPRLCILIQPALKAPPPHRAERPRDQQNANADHQPFHGKTSLLSSFLHDCSVRYIVRYISPPVNPSLLSLPPRSLPARPEVSKERAGRPRFFRRDASKGQGGRRIEPAPGANNLYSVDPVSVLPSPARERAC